MTNVWDTPLHDLDARTVLALIDTGTIRAEDLVQSCLDRIDAREPLIGAFAYLDPEQAMAEARRADANRDAGRLRGLPVGIKDIFDTLDMPTEYGSEIYQGFRPRRNATAVARIRQAGGIIPGKTATTEFAGLCPSKTRNPRNTEYSPGGSSSGSAAAVADRMLPLAIGTQTGGSIIRPAAFCGVVGYKPSFGMIDRTGVRPAVESLDTIGVFARCVGDAALLASVLGGDPQLGDSADRDFVPRIGLCRTRQWNDADADSQKAVQIAAQKLQSSHGVLRDFTTPQVFHDLLESIATIYNYGTLNSTMSEYLHNPSQLSAETLQLIEAGLQVTPQALCSARQHVAQAACAFDQVMVDSGFDVLITPATVGEAPQGLTSTGDSLFNKVWTALGVPALTIPHLTGANGLPLGLQIIGRRNDDRRVTASAAWIESVLAIK
ncbi:amidase [Paracoccus liaowanqingii]|uniref:Amidase n=1 Tax=Paracoccus liaowanqingii TaxID=2560053 RepID=A0A4Z1CB97_9RHOB|nr:amidase [Paracoccus liaowanqingii]TGN61854.1 amidase [Paracoccus liaowanqingii]